MSLLSADYRRAHAGAGPQPSHPSYVAPVVLRADTGEALELDLRRWHDPATTEEAALLATVDGPVIDLGCGPGRLVVSLASRRVPALGVDSSPSAVALARRRGATVLQRDLFGPLPGEGRWATALLFDGNVGIGGDPARLLARCRQLTARRGRVIAEVQPPGTGWRQVTAWFERDGHRSESFDWAVVGADAIAGLARDAGLGVRTVLETPSGRWFAELQAA
ncbi:MAG TPA: methyltransferase domain-containing protein [Acidimicrobiales bacterium]|jgi:SAM-dependent methyltransferase|nr:methyltransferase domain-containing protein [Acidimicrobiales bacterium]